MVKKDRKIPITDDRYNKLISISPIPVVINIGGLIVHSNTAGLHFLQAKNSKALVGKSIIEFVDKEFKQSVRAKMKDLTRDKDVSSEVIQVRFITLKGEHCYGEIAFIALNYGGKRAVQCSIRDVTSQKEIEHKLIRSNNALETIINSSPLAVYVVDPKGKVLVWNKVCETIFGWKKEEVLGKILPLPRKKKLAEFKELMKGLLRGVPFSKDLVRYKKDGSEINVNVSASPILDEQKRVTSVIAISSDISERKKTENLLLDSERKYRMMIEQSLLSTQVLAPDGTTLKVNQAWEELWGISFAQLKNYNMLEDKQLVERGIMPYIKRGFKGEATSIPAIQYVPNESIKDASIIPYKWVEAFIYPVKDEKGKVREIVLVHQDITSRKEFERQKDDFLGIASHELKTPVTSIKMYGQLLNKVFSKKGDKDAVELMNKMDVQINKLSTLITDLLDVTKLQSGRMQFKYSEFSFNALILEVVEQMQLTTDKHKIIKNVSKDHIINADRERIAQVVINLITNAIKYSPNRTQIIVKTSFRSECATCSVQDFGIGIPRQEHKKIFEQFYRSVTSNKDTFPGLGLGLFISQEIITRHGGKIWIDSSTPKGSTFCFKIPFHN